MFYRRYGELRMLEDELDQIAGAWRQWAAHPTAFFTFVHGEVLARKP